MSRRRRDKRQRRWIANLPPYMVYGMRNEDRIHADGTITPGTTFEVWAHPRKRMHG